jgi:hypothetical protein
MGLLTVDELREHVETALPDTALERILASCELAITQWAGPLVIDPHELTVEDVTESVNAPGRTLLLLRQAPTAVTGVVDIAGGIESGVDPSDVRIEGRYLRRLGMASWGERTVVTYTPTDDSAIRRTVLIQLVQLELNVQPGMASQGAGPWSETYGKYLRQRNELLRAIRPADPPMPRSVPYTSAGAR